MTNCTKQTYLSVSLTYRKRGGPVFEWHQTEEPVGDIVVKGDTALRMLSVLNMYHHKQSDPEWFECREPNCHSAAMYVAGLIGSDWSLNPSAFADIYEGVDELITYEQQRPPAVIHLLKERIPSAQLKRINEHNCPHSVLYIGDIGGEQVCFQKHGDGATSLGFLRNAERRYNTQYRLWVGI